MLYLLLIALLGLPLAGTALTLIAEHIKPVRGMAELFFLASVVATVIAGLILRPTSVELVFGNWSPVSFTGTPLVLASNPGGVSILIAVAAAMLLSPFIDKNARENRARPLVSGVLFMALCVSALAHDLVTLLVGISLVDLIVVISGLVQSRNAGRVLRDAVFHAASIALLVIAVTLYDATGNSLYLPLAQISERLMPFFATALAFRFCLAPLRATSDQENSGGWVDKASPVASLLLLSRLPQLGAPELHAWFFAFALLTAISSLVIGALTNSRSRLQTSVETGGLALAVLSAVTWNNGIITAATIAWLLGTSLIGFNTSPLESSMKRAVTGLRVFGAACLIGLPLTIGFIGRSGIVSTWAGRGFGGLALIIGFAVAQALFTLSMIRLIRWVDIPEPITTSIMPIVRAAMMLIPATLILVFGVASELAGAPSFGSQLARNGLGGWFIWLVATAAGIGLWMTEPTWSPRIADWRERISIIAGLGWWQDIMTGAIDRLSKPLHSLVTFLDSDGALLWAVIVILIVVLISRPGGP